jgi:Zn-dependent protease with chaperone function
VANRRRFPQIHPSVFAHPLDTAALRTLQTFKGLDFISKKVLEFGMERIFHIQNIGNRVQVGPDQLPELYGMLRNACAVLDLPQVGMFVETEPRPNAFTYGVSRPVVVLTTGLLDLLEPKEIQAVIGHELGHILCRHVLYRIVATNISTITSIVGEATMGIGKLLSQGLVLALLEWYRKSEYSSDRAGLLVCQDPSVMISVMMKLAGGASKWTKNLNQAAFLRQADQYDALDESNLNRAYKWLQNVNLDHPIPVLRAKEIHAWARSEEYRTVITGTYELRPPCDDICGYCAARLSPADPFCTGCGAPVTGAPQARRRSSAAENSKSCLAAMPMDYDHCPLCGTDLQ